MKLLHHQKQAYNDIIRNVQDDIDLLAYDAFDCAIIIYKAISGKRVAPGQIPAQHLLQQVSNPLFNQLLQLSHQATSTHQTLQQYWRNTPEYNKNKSDHFEYEQVRLNSPLRVVGKQGRPASLVQNKILQLKPNQRKKMEKMLRHRCDHILAHTTLLAAESCYRDQTIEAIENNTDFHITTTMLYTCPDPMVQAITTLVQNAQTVLLATAL